ncbi:GAF and ANTAR domain-containing protein [Actinoplanes friuliensis]|jgi:GAF domain-containing protein|uniref:ANTAR domain-containing protein n=1 Tax=Actinoplanes friuliensis DSM 7358 TaxID=1246995 RepID=U5VZN9_9ACTN|nr:GAF and ANTAR domain-containing protein [Actinoplanes friuliensis]AGZ41180.1 ANTAR domain-containing protein [Actinoplanes friuliensis DSM 7358]
MTDQYPLDPAEAFAEISRIKLSDTNLDGVLEHLARLAKRTIPGAAEVSVTLSRGKGAYTAAYTGELALALDERQYEQGHGPCLDALASGDVMSIDDMGTEERWPDFAARAIEAGPHSSLSVGLPVHESAAGALNVYAIKAHSFDDDGIALAQTFAGYAAVALANAHLYDTQASLANQMQAAMASRAVIEQAKGILMGQRRCSSAEAFAILAKLSQDTNRKLRDVAQALVDSAPVS